MLLSPSVSARTVNRKSSNPTALTALILLTLCQEPQNGQGQGLLKEEAKSGIFLAAL